MSFTYVIPDDYFDQNETEPFDVNLNTISCNPKPLDPTAGAISSLILVANFLLAIPGNLLVGWVISSSRQVLTSSDVYLFHLTVADGLMALTLPFFAVALVWGWLFGDFMCKFLNLVIEANFYTSIIFLACISVDRYLVIVHANETHGTKQRKCSRILCAAVWALGWGLALPALFNDAFKLDENSERLICTERFDIGSVTSWRIATRGFRHIFGFLIPLAVMVACYGVTVTRLLNTRGFQKHRAMRVIIAVVIAFLLCWAPYHITMMIDTLVRTNLIPFDCSFRRSVTLALDITNTLALLHSSINPFLYAFVGEKFRKKMMYLMQKKFRQERMSGSKASRSTSQTSEGTGTIL
ncbi:C-X-C chemokine receptor type 1-like [Xiphophorus maculatus]|uniref:C-X-C chemokine receptor type 1-like n=1 Tax=Xiphophorus maculatus TaxID=8083 RepID=M4AZ88_XIPMA|nr:C-X-C chemokine receptor type 1-like [Xiphophorus maculatus]XP_023185025.1 C-X-C chemokine receptor type 1-like [Xiphophorus maculatus]